MDGFAAVRALARVKHAEMLLHTNGNACATALLLAARFVETMTVQILPKSHPLLGDGDGALRRRTRMIAVCAEASPELQAFYEAHEWGHFWTETEADPVHVSIGIDPGIPEEPSPLGIHRVEAYSAQELRERYANVFAREFLLPTDVARRLFVDEGKSSSTIAAELGLPIPLVYQQLAVSLLLPVPVAEQRGHEGSDPGLDPSQRAAAERRAKRPSGPCRGRAWHWEDPHAYREDRVFIVTRSAAFLDSCAHLFQ
jgi:Zn-dependent peptidase ImmA (M78 family)